MILSDLSAREIARRLRGPGLRLRTGPFTLSIKSRLDAIARGLDVLYADFPVVDDCPLADFHVSVSRPWNLRRWLLPEGIFALGGHFRFEPFQLYLAPAYFEWGLNWCISNHAHHLLMLHAASLERDGRTMIVVGRSGAGKSTLCAALALSGWRLLSDEFALISPTNGQVLPLARPISLKNESIDLVRGLAPQRVCFGPVCEATDKGRVTHMKPPAEAVRRAGEPAPPGWFVLLDWRPEGPAELRRATKVQTMLRAARRSFNYGILGRRGFDTLARAVDRSQCFRFRYSRLEQAIEVFNRHPFVPDRMPASQPFESADTL